MKVSSVNEMRFMDTSAIEKYGIIEELLMENAALATCFVIQDEFGVKGKRFAIFCGMGNNGGDGFAVARKLHSNGGNVMVYILGDVDKLNGAAKLILTLYQKFPWKFRELNRSNL
jgi:NAD(P)H-hydrate epimerase